MDTDADADIDIDTGADPTHILKHVCHAFSIHTCKAQIPPSQGALHFGLRSGPRPAALAAASRRPEARGFLSIGALSWVVYEMNPTTWGPGFGPLFLETPIRKFDESTVPQTCWLRRCMGVGLNYFFPTWGNSHRNLY